MAAVKEQVHGAFSSHIPDLSLGAVRLVLCGREVTQSDNSMTVAEKAIQPNTRLLFVYQPLELTWDPDKSRQVVIDASGLRVRPLDSVCRKLKYAVTGQPLPTQGRYFWEITIHHRLGCYDSIGVVKGTYSKGCRLGTTATGWAVRVYGVHTGAEHFGAIHANNHKDFYRSWKQGDRVGVLYCAAAKSLTYFCNGKLLGTPFTNLEGGDLYPCVEICHLGSMTAKFGIPPPPTPPHPPPPASSSPPPPSSSSPPPP
eukprot:CAMPEP_0175121638 /NCGR_PEP_ID=MMETSP0087-20121206/1278_1 /TAXON_ID=136419 /ORGANISM="Unknown Unknown, Strain D1" /LENGTH=255 /DNA_ID=CAMNT_0016403199 /DNA_START=55 /DNA_END=822 /DNA_ORIENTATION=-